MPKRTLLDMWGDDNGRRPVRKDTTTSNESSNLARKSAKTDTETANKLEANEEGPVADADTSVTEDDEGQDAEPAKSTSKVDTSATEDEDKPDVEPAKSKSRVTERTGDIFAAPDNTLLIHACNCKGSWGSGIAEAFRKLYPKAYVRYRGHCIGHRKGAAPGKALLIPPCEDKGPKHYIGCLYTSNAYGLRKDKPEDILTATKASLSDLLTQVAELKGGEKIKEVRICQINSGRFAVPWMRTLRIINKTLEEHESPLDIAVWSR